MKLKKFWPKCSPKTCGGTLEKIIPVAQIGSHRTIVQKNISRGVTKSTEQIRQRKPKKWINSELFISVTSLLSLGASKIYIQQEKESTVRAR